MESSSFWGVALERSPSKTVVRRSAVCFNPIIVKTIPAANQKLFPETTRFRCLSPFVGLVLLMLIGFVSVSTAATGPILIATDYPHSFQYQSGERFFPMGDTAYFLIRADQRDRALHRFPARPQI